MNSINDRIKEVRLLLRMSQEDFGKAIGLSKSGISNIEKGEREIRDVYLTAICNTFNINLHWLRTGEGNPLLAEAVSSCESFVDYIKSVGYAVQSYSSPDGESTIIELTKGGKSTEFDLKEFEDFQLEIENTVDYQVWKKQKRQGKK